MSLVSNVFIKLSKIVILFKMKIFFLSIICLFCLNLAGRTQVRPQSHPPVSYETADKRADAILSKMSIEDKIQLISGDNAMFIKGFKKYGIPEMHLTDASQGVRIRKKSSNQLEKSTAFPCPLALSSTWNPVLAQKYATSIGEECRAGGIAVLLGPGMNIYRISQCGRNFEYFGEDPYLSSRMIENYVVGVQSTGTVATLKHFLCNNTDFHRRNSNSIVDERTLHEIYLPAFKAGVDAGVMSVMTSYNLLNGEWCGQSSDVIDQLLRKELGFKWFVMTDWFSVWDAKKIIKSGMDIEMAGDREIIKDALTLLKNKEVKETEINRMAKAIIRTFIAMGLYDRPVKDEKYLSKFPEHEKIALQTAREAIVLLKNKDNILPLKGKGIHKIILTGDYVDTLARGGGSAMVEGYNTVTMLQALKNEFGDRLFFAKNPTDEQIKSADVILISVGTSDSEGCDRPFSLPDEKNKKILDLASKNPKVVVIVNSGSGIQMTNWNDKVQAIVYSWYVGQNGNTALAEILSGKTNPSGKLPITIEKKFEDSPGYGYLPEGQQLYTGWKGDGIMKDVMNDVNYKEGVFVGYRWYESKKIEPLYHFGHGLSYTNFEYGKINLSAVKLKKNDRLVVQFTVKNIGKVAGAEIAQLYIQDVISSVPRPVKELKGFSKVSLKPGEAKVVKIVLTDQDFSFWDVNKKGWNEEPGDFNILIGSASDDILKTAKVTILK